jgi:hypothetical protein
LLGVELTDEETRQVLNGELKFKDRLDKIEGILQQGSEKSEIAKARKKKIQKIDNQIQEWNELSENIKLLEENGPPAFEKSFQALVTAGRLDDVGKAFFGILPDGKQQRKKRQSAPFVHKKIC